MRNRFLFYVLILLIFLLGWYPFPSKGQEFKVFNGYTPYAVPGDLAFSPLPRFEDKEFSAYPSFPEPRLGRMPAYNESMYGSFNSMRAPNVSLEPYVEKKYQPFNALPPIPPKSFSRMREQPAMSFGPFDGFKK